MTGYSKGPGDPQIGSRGDRARRPRGVALGGVGGARSRAAGAYARPLRSGARTHAPPPARTPGRTHARAARAWAGGSDAARRARAGGGAVELNTYHRTTSFPRHPAPPGAPDPRRSAPPDQPTSYDVSGLRHMSYRSIRHSSDAMLALASLVFPCPNGREASRTGAPALTRPERPHNRIRHRTTDQSGRTRDPRWRPPARPRWFAVGSEGEATATTTARTDRTPHGRRESARQSLSMQAKRTHARMTPAGRNPHPRRYGREPRGAISARPS